MDEATPALGALKQRLAIAGWAEGPTQVDAADLRAALELVDAQAAHFAVVEAERDRAREAAHALLAGLEWALVNGGWRLWYYADRPPASVIPTPIGAPAEVAPEILAALGVDAWSTRPDEASRNAPDG